MRAIAPPVLALLLLAGCGDSLSEEEQRTQNAAIADRVREANSAGPPVEDVVPEVIGYPDMEANDLFGLACAYAPGTSMGVRVIAREADAWMKLDGQMIRFAADPGSRQLPAGTRTLYNGQKYSLRLAVEEAEVAAEAGAGETVTYPGTMWLYDRLDRVVYTGSGTANCGGSGA